MENQKLTPTKLLYMIVMAEKEENQDRLKALIESAKNMLETPSRRPRRRQGIYTSPISVKVEPSLKEWYREAAKKEKIRVSELYRLALVDYMSKEKGEIESGERETIKNH